MGLPALAAQRGSCVLKLIEGEQETGLSLHCRLHGRAELRGEIEGRFCWIALDLDTPADPQHRGFGACAGDLRASAPSFLRLLAL